MENLLVYILSLVLCFTGCNAYDIQVEEEPTEVETVAPTEPEIVYAVTGKVIVVDAGHGLNSSKEKEAIAPTSSEKKAAFATGTSGKNQTEEQLVLSLALKLQAALEERGAIVHMTRTGHETTLSNVGRAKFGNEHNADLSFKIHADGNNSSAPHGTSMLVPGGLYITDKNMLDESRKAGEIILEEYVKATGAKNRGISVRNDMTGFNWSTVPVVLLEVGFMTNPDEDARMETEEYQNKMVEGMLNGIEAYFTNK